MAKTNNLFLLFIFLLCTGLSVNVHAGPTCGNDVTEVLEGFPAETCDDGNEDSGDGCSSDCTVETGYSCVTTDEPSTCTPICGDGMIIFPEACDDGLLLNDDGCSSSCAEEDGWTCVGQPSICTLDCVATGPEICDGIDNDCNGSIDDGIADTTSSCGVGECAANGVLSCVAGAEVDSCVEGAPSAEVCDGLDNSCSGSVDDGIADTPTSCGVGVCAADGVLSCVAGAEVDSCTPGPAGTEGPFGDDTCSDGLDNDCNETTDDADASCAEVCVPTGDEICDGIDNDCNGSIDDGIADTPTSCGVGVCAADGVLSCVAGAEVDSCTPGPAGTEGPFGDDTCSDGLDNDCNETTDDADASCAEVCVPTGDEICDGIDNDCNGSIDDGIADTPTSCGVGVCAADGVLSCVAGAEVDSCTPGPAGTEGPFGDDTCSDGLDNDCNETTDDADASCAEVCVPTGDEICDGIDNDCNGSIDDGIADTPTSCGVGECAADGVLSCVAGAEVDSCVEGAPSAEVCDGLDNSCSGSVDDGIADTPTSCGVGVCAADGVLSCVAGAEVDSCTPGPAGTEGPFGDDTCSDGLDNDCNETTDDADASCAESGTTVMIDGCDSGVTDTGGIESTILACRYVDGDVDGDEVRNHGQFVRCSARFLNGLGLTTEEKDAIQSCVGSSDFGKPE